MDNVRESEKEKAFKILIRLSNILLTISIDLKKVFFKQIIDAFCGNLEMIISGGSSIDERYIKDFCNIEQQLQTVMGLPNALLL